MSKQTHDGGYVNQWVRCSSLPGPDGERRHLLFAVITHHVIGERGPIAMTDPSTPLACGLKIGPNIWDWDDTSPKCEKCKQVAEGGQPSEREDVPAPREREPVAA